MANKPLKDLPWGTDPSAVVVEPMEATKRAGYGNGEPLGAGAFNWMFKHIGDWIQYLSDGDISDRWRFREGLQSDGDVDLDSANINITDGNIHLDSAEGNITSEQGTLGTSLQRWGGIFADLVNVKGLLRADSEPDVGEANARFGTLFARALNVESPLASIVHRMRSTANNASAEHVLEHYKGRRTLAALLGFDSMSGVARVRAENAENGGDVRHVELGVTPDGAYLGTDGRALDVQTPLSLDSQPDVAPTTPQTNALHKALVPKAWAVVEINHADNLSSPSVSAGANIASVVAGTDDYTYRVNFAQPMSADNAVCPRVDVVRRNISGDQSMLVQITSVDKSGFEFYLAPSDAQKRVPREKNLTTEYVSNWVRAFYVSAMGAQ